MKIVSIKYFPYELIFRNPFRTSRTKSSSRKVYYIQVTTENNNHYYGECAPLPEFGSEDFHEVEGELKNLSELKNLTVPFSEEELKAFLNEYTSLPTVKCGLEQAVFEIFASANQSPIPLKKKKEINVNGLVDLISKDEIITSVERLYTSGYSTIKLKAGRKNVDEDIDILSALKKKFEDKILLRLDVNGKWNYEEAVNNIKLLENYNIQYIEQPVKNIDDLIKLSNHIDFPLAADESIRNIKDVKQLLNQSQIKYLVIKPMLIGGYYNTKEIVELADSKNVNVIISSSLESNLGRKHLVMIAASTGNNLAHGLGTSSLFINDNTKDIFPVENGKIYLE